MHDLVALLNLCLSEDKTLEFLRDASEVLNQYYIETKYPLDTPLLYPKEKAKEAIAKAKFVLKTITGKIK